mgnify:CR=1 FL=1
MADTNATKSVFSLIATSSSRIRDLVIKDGQLVFIQDLGRIAFDFKGERVFYNQIVELSTEAERQSLESPLSGYYFVIDSAVLWFYKDDWIQITEKPEEVVFIGVELPELGQEKTLYVDKDDCEISVWDEETKSYIVVADKTESVIGSIEEEYINSLF